MKKLSIVLIVVILSPYLVFLFPTNIVDAAENPPRTQSKTEKVTGTTTDKYPGGIYWTQMDNGDFHAGYGGQDFYAPPVSANGKKFPGLVGTNKMEFDMDVTSTRPDTWLYKGSEISGSLVAKKEIDYATWGDTQQFIADGPDADKDGKPIPKKKDDHTVTVRVITGGDNFDDTWIYNGLKWQTLYKVPIDVKWKGVVTETKEIDVNPDSTMAIGQTKQLNASVRTKGFLDASILTADWVPVRSDPETVWKSSDETIVYVNPKTGFIEAKKAGTATIRATWTKDGYEISDSATITVGAGPTPTPTPTPPPVSFTADFEVTPTTFEYNRSSFSIKPKNFSMNSCIYQSHQYKIERDGLSWTSSAISGQNTTTTYSSGSYPYVIGVGSHSVYMKIKTTNCGESEWIRPKSLTVTSPITNSPPIGEIAFVRPSQPTVPVTTAIEGERLDLVLIYDPSKPIPRDPDGDAVHWDGFDFSQSDAWTKTIPTMYGIAYDYHNILMDGLGVHYVKGILRDEWGATTTLTAYIDVTPPNPVAKITGPTEVVEGRPLMQPLSADQSYSPAGRAIDHGRDTWTNKKSVYTTPGTEIVKLDVYDMIGLKSLTPATHTLTVKPDLPPVPQLDYIPTTMRGNEIIFTNSSYSPDGDTIVSNTVYYQYDANNDGVYAESINVVTMDANKKFSIKPTQVGSYRFTVQVREDWGKEAYKYFYLSVVNDAPDARFSIKGTAEEPIIAPYTYITPAQMVSSAWASTNLRSAQMQKRYVVDPRENSVVATTDKLKHSGLTTSIASVEYYNGASSWFSADKWTYNKYLGDGLLYATNYPFLHEANVINTSMTKLKTLDKALLQYFDFEGGYAYGYRFPNSNLSYLPIKVKIADLKNAGLSTMPYEDIGPTLSIPNVDQLFNNDAFSIESRIGLNTTETVIVAGAAGPMKITKTGVSLYEWGAFSPYAWVPYSSKLPFNYSQANNGYPPVIDGFTQDPYGNVYITWYASNYGSIRGIYRVNGVTGEVDWVDMAIGSVASGNGGAASFSRTFASDGKYLVHAVGSWSNYVKYIVSRNAVDGTVNKFITYTDNGAYGASYTHIEYFDGIFVVMEGNKITAYDGELNQRWSITAPDYYYYIENGRSRKVMGVSKDGYLMYVGPVDSSNITRFYMINVYTGAVQSLNADIQAIADDIASVSMIDDSTLFISYKNTTYRYGKVVRTSNPMSSILANDYDSSGQLVSPSANNLANGEMVFDLKFNGTPQATRSAGLGFRIQDYRNYYRVEVFAGTVELVKYVNGVRTLIGYANYPIGKTSYLTYKVKVVGNSLKVYVSGTPVIEVTDGTFSAAGDFGIYSSSPKSEFKNVGYRIFGSNAIMYDNIALVNSNVSYTTTYSDPENDPKIDALAEWQFVQTDANKFLNAGDGKSGTSSLHNKTVQSPYLTFDKVGLYQVSYKVKDDPNASYLYPSMVFDSYRKASDPYSQYVVVHRKPIAQFTLSLGAGSKVLWTDYSHDPDRWLSATNYSSEETGIDYRTTKGIIEKKFYYIPPSGTVRYEKLVSPTEVGTYTVGMAVKDEYGAWSDWYEQSIYVGTVAPPNTPPVPGFTLSTTSTYRGVGVTINSTASDAEDGDRTKLPHEYYIKNTTTGGAETLQSTSRTSWVKTFNTMGVFTIRQVVEDSQGAIAQIVKQVTISNRLPVTNVTTPSSTNQSSPTKLTVLRPTFTWTYSDADSDSQSQHQVRIYRNGGTLQLDSGVKTGAATSWTPSGDLPEKTNLYIQVRAYDGYDWGNWSAAKYFYIETNQPPTGDFTWTPNSVYEGDTVQFQSAVTDPDGDSLAIHYELTAPSGSKYTSDHTIAVPYTSQAGPSIRMTTPGNWTVRMTVSDGIAPVVVVTKTVRVESLHVVGAVKHTEAWEANRLAYNATNNPERPPSMFWAGEAFVLEAVTSDTGTSSSTKTSNVIVRMFEDNAKALASSDTAKASWSGMLRSSDTNIDFTKLADGNYTFVFTATYSNGTVKTDSVTIMIKDSTASYVQVHRLQ